MSEQRSDIHAAPSLASDTAEVDPTTARMIRLEHFLDNVLRQSLNKVLRERETVHTMASQCCQLRQLFQEMRGLSATHSFIRDRSDDEVATTAAHPSNSSPPAGAIPQRAHIMVDIGNQFFVQCTVNDASKVWVNLGCGVVLDMTTDEANVFLEAKEKLLRERAVSLSKEILRIKYRIRLVMAAITRLYDCISN